MKRVALVFVAAAVALSAAACGGGGNDGGPTPGADASPGPTTTPRPPIAPAERCQESQEPLASYNVQVTAHWQGKDRVVIDGSAQLPGSGSVNYLICQDGQVSASVVWALQPTFKSGKIHAESKVAESRAGPVFDPDAHFTVVLSVLGDQIQMPYFTISVPVEGKPE